MSRYVLAVASACLLTGCGGSDIELTDLSGKVTFAGQPVVYGQIEFVPDSGKGHQGPAGTAEIVDGSYSTRSTGRGVLPGPHLVRITAYEERPVAASDDETAPSSSKPPIFSGFTLEKELKEKSQDFDVPETARGFDLFKSRPAAPRSNIP
jgi:hypothetical protein